ncbi:MAG: NPCBM/NEW2 domain-containing protein [Planctomycetota bacterium]
MLTTWVVAIALGIGSTATAQDGPRSRWSMRVDRFTGETVVLYGTQGVLTELRLFVEGRQGTEPARLWEIERGDRSRYDAVTASGDRFEFSIEAGDSAESARLVARRRAGTGENPVRIHARAKAILGPQPLPVRLEPDESGILQTSLGGYFSRRCDSVYDRSRGQAVRFDVGLTSGEDEDVILLDRRVTLESDQIGILEMTYVSGLPTSLASLGEAETVSRSAPSGWMADASYGRTESEILETAIWLVTHWRGLGAETLWLGSSELDTLVRQVVSDSSASASLSGSEAFPRGIQWLNEQLRRLEFRPGLVFNPFVEANEAVWSEALGRFVGAEAPLRPNGPPVRVLDPTSRAAWEFLDAWGEAIGVSLRFRDLAFVDQGAVYERWQSEQARLSAPSTPLDKAYRESVARLSAHLKGESRLIDIDGSLPSELERLFDVIGHDRNGSSGWFGVQDALENTLAGYFPRPGDRARFPGAVRLGDELSTDQARAWVTLIGLTGQAAMVAGDLRSMPDAQRQAFSAILPPLAIRPLDLYRPEGRPNIFNLRLRIDDQTWDLLALFNWTERADLRSVDFASLGWDRPKAPRHVYEFWEQQYLGEVRESLIATVPPTGVRLYVISPLRNQPQVVGTTRHIIPGVPEDLEVKWDTDLGVMIGSFKNLPDREYSVYVTLRGGDVEWELERIQARGAAAYVDEGTGLLTIRFGAIPRPPERNTFRLQLRATPRDIPSLSPPEPLLGTPLEDQVVLRWRGVDGACLYEVFREGKRIARDFDTTFVDRSPPLGQRVRYEVYAIDSLGRRSPGVYSSVSLGKPRDIEVDRLPMVDFEGSGRVFRRSFGETPLSIGSRKFSRGIGIDGDARVHFDLRGSYARFTSLAGVLGDGSAIFRVWVDGQMAAESEALTAESEAWSFEVPTAEAARLTLEVEPRGEGAVRAVWGDAELHVR